MKPVGFAATLLLGLSAASSASAFCRTTTCDNSNPAPDCKIVNQCMTGGRALYWPDLCVSFSLQVNASPRREISLEQADSIISAGFAQWLGADCGGKNPGISLYDRSPVNCSEAEYNKKNPNANIWMFRDASWPYAGRATLALTTVTFNVETGEIYDADVEINSDQQPLTTGDTGVKADLLSIVTHEAGHFLGLSHTPVGNATMFASYTNGSTSLRSLEADDVAGICAVYPPERATAGVCNPEPRHGFSTECGRDTEKGCCTTAPGGPGRHAAGALLLALIAFMASKRRRAKKRGPNEPAGG